MGPSQWAMDIATRLYEDPEMQLVKLNKEDIIAVAYVLDTIKNQQGVNDAKI